MRKLCIKDKGVFPKGKAPFLFGLESDFFTAIIRLENTQIHKLWKTYSSTNKTISGGLTMRFQKSNDVLGNNQSAAIMRNQVYALCAGPIVRANARHGWQAL